MQTHDWKDAVIRGAMGTEFEKVEGRATGGIRVCQLEGCCGVRVATRWPDGRITYPCSKGLIGEGDHIFRIG